MGSALAPMRELLVRDVSEMMQEEGWVPFGSYFGKNILALGKRRFLYDTSSEFGETGVILSDFSQDVSPRIFASASDVRHSFGQMVEKIRSDGVVPELLSIPLVYTWREVLNVDEDRLETTEMDKRRRATFDVMPEELRFVLWKSYRYRSEYLKDYVAKQEKWGDDSEHFLGEHKGGPPTFIERSNEYISRGVALEFRIHYSLRHPDRMELIQEKIDLSSANLREPYELPSEKVA